jgi:hypothetical protein
MTTEYIVEWIEREDGEPVFCVATIHASSESAVRQAFIDFGIDADYRVKYHETDRQGRADALAAFEGKQADAVLVSVEEAGEEG